MSAPSSIDTSAAALAHAWSTDSLTESPFSARVPDRVEAYAIQDRLVELLSPRLGPRVGWKLGMTAPGLADDPIVGPIHREMLVAPGSRVKIRPGMLIEVEIALHIRPDADPERLALSDLEVGAAFEILGFRTSSREVCDGIADLATMHHVVLGSTRPLGEVADLGRLEGTLGVDGDQVAMGVSHQTVAPPLESLDWLQGHLFARRRRLAPGDAVITGSLTGQFPVRPGKRHTGSISGLATISIEFDH
ncbi:MAG TPA: hypothetical protein VLB85_06675 [Acidimicrobiia bacterium]|nr:hypothetical protein [Acidimicrobiia bacterium]